MRGKGPIRQITISAAAAAVVWTAAAVGAFLWISAFAHRSVVALAVAQARASVQKDLAYRRWAWERGGVYVPLSPAAPPSPYLRAQEREVVTPSGRILTLVNPAYMMRQVLEADRNRGGARGRIMSARPLRPENQPDAWEADALAKLESGAEEVVEDVEHEAPVLRYMARLPAEDRCRACHGVEGEAGGVRGGVSIAVPMQQFFRVADAQVVRFGTVIAIVWVVGIAGIAFGAMRGCRHVREREREQAARSALEQELAHARRLEAIGRLSGGIAHDLNNLLSPILGNSALALERVPPGGGELRQDLEDIHEAAQRARALTQRLLAFGRKQVLNVEALDASEVIEALMPMLRRLVPEGLQMGGELGRGLPPIRADRAQLEAVVLNLVANARDAMGTVGTIRLSTSLEVVDADRATRAGISPGRYVALAVSDTGSGIDPAHMTHLFEPFFTTKPTGTGLGLASAHGTVRQLWGAIEVETTVAGGSTFRVLLPAMDSDASPQKRSRPTERPRGGRETVLLVEDEPAVRRYVAAALGSLGYHVLEAADGEEALQVAERHAGELDALVSDLRMPRVGGRELQARLASERPELPTVFITGYAGDAGGPVPFPARTVLVQKPFTPADLADAMRRVLDARPRAQG